MTDGLIETDDGCGGELPAPDPAVCQIIRSKPLRFKPVRDRNRR